MTFVPRDLSKLEERLASLAALPAGWFESTTPALSAVALQRAGETLRWLLRTFPTLPRPAVFPGLDGRVSAQWAHGDWEVNLRFDAKDGAMHLGATNVVTREEIDRAVGPDARDLVAALRPVFGSAFTVML